MYRKIILYRIEQLKLCTSTFDINLHVTVKKEDKMEYLLCRVSTESGNEIKITMGKALKIWKISALNAMW